MALVMVMLVIVANILMRAWWKPLTGSYELVEILGAILLSMGVAYCAMQKSHVAMTFLVERMSPRNKAWTELGTNLISCLFLSLIAWGMLKHSARMYHRGLSTTALDLPLYPIYYLVAFGLIVLVLVALLELVKSLLLIIRGGAKN